MTGGMSGGHFIGFFLAVLGLVLLLAEMRKPVERRWFGRLRWFHVVAMSAQFVLLSVFCSGFREIYFRTAVGPSAGVIRRVEQAHVDAALANVLRPEFVQYIARLDGGPLVDRPERFRDALSVRAGTTVDLDAQGYRFDPPPEIGQTWLFVSYSDNELAPVALLRFDDPVRRMVLAERIVTRVLPQAAALEALRMAKTDDEKLSILRENPFVMPYAAEWIWAELGKLAKDASPALSAEIAQKRAYVQKYVEDPTARGLSAGARADAP